LSDIWVAEELAIPHMNVRNRFNVNELFNFADVFSLLYSGGLGKLM
jgi:hypothetical protein